MHLRQAQRLLAMDGGDGEVRITHQQLATGIVNNELYAGVLVWNRLRYIKNSASG